MQTKGVPLHLRLVKDKFKAKRRNSYFIQQATIGRTPFSKKQC